MSKYAKFEVPHVWLIDPNSKTLEVFRLEAAKWVRISAHAEDDKVHAEPFQEIEIDLARLWMG
jgi:Uma2 family endonuclease